MKVTQSRNKREGWYCGKLHEQLRTEVRKMGKYEYTYVVGYGPVRFCRGAARIDSLAKFRRAGG